MVVSGEAAQRGTYRRRHSQSDQAQKTRRQLLKRDTSDNRDTVIPYRCILTDEILTPAMTPRRMSLRVLSVVALSRQAFSRMQQMRR